MQFQQKFFEMKIINLKLSEFVQIGLTYATFICGILFLAALLMGIPYLIGLALQIFWINNNTIDTTKYFFFAYAALFLVVVGIFIPLARKVFSWLQIAKINPFDSIGSALIFLASCLPLIILSKVTIFLLKRKCLTKYKYRMMNFTVSAALFLLGVRVIYKGKRDLEAKIVIANHTSPLDYALKTQSMGVRPFNIVAGINLHYNRKKLEDKVVASLLGYFVKNYAISVERNSRASRAKAYERMLEEIKSGKYVGIFPEGGRNPKEQIKQGIILQEFQDGAFRLSFETGESIQPIIYTLPSDWRGKDDDFWGIRPCKITAHWLGSFNPKDYDSFESLKQACWSAMDLKLRDSRKIKNLLKKIE
ncbi:MAG TPA: lysophospholipid acyltransferase family protein [Candidatus Paceibacterota bacterium]|nr:lysophospholipid acyltransferase family protein [Candidatus Paceibacterota bacterium]